MNIEKIWPEYRSGIKSFLHSKISNNADVDDLLQDIMIKSFEKLDTLQSDENLKAWIYQIARNSVIDFYRKKSAEPEVNPADLWYGESNGPDDHILSNCVRPFIEVLHADAAELLIAIDLEGMSQKEYAHQHDISYSTLKSRVHKARQDLRGLFDKCCRMSVDGLGNINDYHPKSDDCSAC